MEVTLDNIYSLFLQSRGISTDSRQIRGGELFFALKGNSFDGNRFAPQALERGAVGCVVDDPELVNDSRYIFVANTLETLQALAHHHRSQMRCSVIAITGTNGKTTTKELLAAVLQKKYHTIYTRGNLNNHIGVPLTLLEIQPETEVAIIEMGANHPGEIDFLCRIAEPDFGIITNIGKAHLEGFGGFDGVIHTKTELYRFLEEKKGRAFVNGMDDLLLEKSSTISRVLYNTPQSGVFAELLDDNGLLKIRLYLGGNPFDLKTHLVGAYNIPNITAAAAIGHYFGVDPYEIADAMGQYVPSNLRSQYIETAFNRVIMDAYNANPSSMRVALENFIRQPHKPKAVILGEMLELGEASEKEHAEIVRIAKESDLDVILLTGKGFRNSASGNWFETTVYLKEFLGKYPLRGYLILVKGSRGNRLEQILDVL